MSENICIFGVLVWRNGNDNDNGSGIATVWVGIGCRKNRLGIRFVCMYVARYRLRR